MKPPPAGRAAEEPNKALVLEAFDGGMGQA
jgi:hypothetical protein